VLLLAGGNIPRPDFGLLAELGVHGIFPTGTPFEAIVRFLRDKVRP
jgi:methylmalonyl-CoA mutase cobalamin-binding domain/chain